MITRFHVQNYKSLRDVTLELTPVHVLIGPNNSGKTSILEAIQALCMSVDFPFGDQAFIGQWKGTELVWRGGMTITLEATISGGITFDYQVRCSFSPGLGRAILSPQGRYICGETKIETQNANSGLPIRFVSDEAVEKWVVNALHGVHYYRWDPRHLALPVAPDSSRRYRMDASGFGLALLLDDILGYDRVLFAEIERQLQAIFPEIRSLKLQPELAFRAALDYTKSTPMLALSDGKGIYFQMENNPTLVPASQASDGVLLILAYLAVANMPYPPKVILLEEPENGIHPKRLDDVVSILRGIAKDGKTQVILTTHSPYLVDLFAPDEVTVCRHEDGETKASRLSDSKSVRDQLDIFSLGEIWTAEGDEKLALTATAESKS